MPPHESYRGEFIRILLSSAVFQQGLNTISQIASEVQAHAPPLPNDNNQHSFQFGQQWKFTDLADSRFIQATVSDIRQHLSSAESVELPELTDTRFMGLKPSIYFNHNRCAIHSSHGPRHHQLESQRCRCHSARRQRPAAFNDAALGHVRAIPYWYIYAATTNLIPTSLS